MPIYAPEDVLTEPRELSKIFALTVSGGMLEYVGSVTQWTEQVAWPLGSTDVALTTVEPGGLIVVEGWLVSANGHVVSCGPYLPRPSLPPDSPFGCFPDTWIADRPHQPVTVLPNGVEMRAPDVGIAVQRGAYQRFAPEPSTDGQDRVIPREGAYLIRVVEDTWTDCTTCLGWQVVARLSPVVRLSPTD